ncbi:transcription factor lir-3 [Ditylenchus destructor]|nr:transcription factor lir-3 [Ditylenchus destructor]
MRNPNYAIVKIPERANVVGFYQLLLEHGFCEVSFVNEVRENAFLPHSELGENNSNSTNMAGVSKHSDPMQRLAMPNSESGNDRRNLGNGSGISDTAFGSNSGRTSALLPDPMRTRMKQPSSQPPDQFRVGNRPLSNAVSPVMSPFGYGTPNTARPRGMRTNAIQVSNASQSGESATDEPIYATCQLCQNKIMSTRLSNLTNHVRRHASMKQYQCKHCSYSHNEMAKVRLHMQHNHQDFASQPHDAICYEMQLQWGLLMEQCFPEHAKRFGPSATTIQSRELDQDQYVNTENIYTCVECGEMVEGSGLGEHLHEAHRKDCVPYGCSDCNFMSAAPSSVRLHISMKHSDRVGEASVNPLPPGTNYTPFFHRFFPEIPKEEEECKVGDFIKQRLTKQQSDRNVNRDESPLEETITCEMCDGSVLSCKSMTGLLEHAKRHYVVKQFRCPDCTHACVDISSMRTHISIKHPGSESEPIDLLSDDLQVAWVDTMKKCFPHLHDRIDDFATSELNPQVLSNMGDPPSVSKSQTETAEEFDESTASASPISASSSANLDNNGCGNGSGMHSNQISKERRNSDAPGPMYDVQFDESGVISKIRAAKRQYSHLQNDVEDEHGETEDSRELNQPSESARHKLRSGKLRHVSAEDYNQDDEQAYSPTVRTTRNSARRQQ